MSAGTITVLHLGSPAEHVIREGDYFAFQWSEENRRKAGGDIDWCFDGRLLAKVDRGGDIRLRDTYWTDPTHGLSFTPAEATLAGTLIFIANLDELDVIKEHELVYYADADVVNLSSQHGCYKKFAIRKGTKRNREAMLESVTEKIRKAAREIDSAVRYIELYAGKRALIEAGDLEVSI